MLWRERHPKGHEQVMLDFAFRERPADSAKFVRQDDAHHELLTNRKTLRVDPLKQSGSRGLGEL
jgi:hypothetical protein